MKKISENINEVYNQLGENNSLAKIAHRAARVRAMWAACVQEYVLAHTNAVYIVKNDSSSNKETYQKAKTAEPEEKNQPTPTKTLIVYVDDSITATELNARRELIKLKFLQDFNEEIEELKIFISRGDYKKNYPFKKSYDEELQNTHPTVPLTKNELKSAQEIASVIEDERLREKLLKAMVADLEWKKSETL